MSKQKIRDGSVFVVPLRNSGVALGVVARCNGKGICFGYFFRHTKTEREYSFECLKPEDAVLVGKFGDLALRNGKWKVVGQLNASNDNRWPFPALARIDQQANRAWLSQYDDQFNCVKEVVISIDEAGKHPYDRLMGAGSVEIRLNEIYYPGT